MEALTAPTTVSLFDVLRERQAQAQRFGAAYGAPVADTDSMLFWLSRALSTAREAADRKQVHVAASASVDQSSVARLEKGISWPRDPERFVNAYADDLDIDSIDLWEEAVRQWRAHREGGAGDPADIIEPLAPTPVQGGSRRKPGASGTSKRSSSAGRRRQARS